MVWTFACLPPFVDLFAFTSYILPTTFFPARVRTLCPPSESTQHKFTTTSKLSALHDDQIMWGFFQVLIKIAADHV